MATVACVGIAVLDTIMIEGTEEDFRVARGDVWDEVRALAALLDLPVVDVG